MIRIGIDIGGSKIEIAALAEDGRVLFRRREPAPRGDYGEALEFIAKLVRDAERAAEAKCSVGIGTPGATSRETGRLKNAYASPLNGMPVKRDLEKILGREVRLANDANCFALSEAFDGAAKGHRVVFGAILGTGVGGGIVVDGRAFEGANAISGEWGHNPLPWPLAGELPGPRCSCGRCGCIEAFLSGPALAFDHRRAGGAARSPSEIVAAAESGDRDCVATLERYEDRLARALASVINLLDPDIIVLGGGLSNAARLYRYVPSRWGKYVYSDTVVTPLVCALHGDSSGVLGAARLW